MLVWTCKTIKRNFLPSSLQISLWGNKCDLSISAGTENSQQDDSLSQLSSLKSYLLVDDTTKVWNKLKGLKVGNIVQVFHAVYIR